MNKWRTPKLIKFNSKDISKLINARAYSCVSSTADTAFDQTMPGSGGTIDTSGAFDAFFNAMGNLFGSIADAWNHFIKCGWGTFD